MAHPPSKRTIDLFIEDSQRLCARALKCISMIEAESPNQDSISPQRMQELFHLVHTLKGVTLMMEGAQYIGHNLHELESSLSGTLAASQHLPLVAKVKVDWLAEAKETLEASARDVASFTDQQRAA